MREIKFRAWLLNEKRMHYIDGFYDPVMSYNDEETCIIVQYTGIKDTSGKEIYDLHILNNKFIVVFYQYIVCIVDISNGDILKKGLKRDELEITGEYFSLPEDSKRSVDKYIRQAESAFKNQEICFAVV